MADQHHGGAEGGEFGFQPGDGGQVEMVGGFVEQQHIGRGGERTGQGGAAGLAAGEVIGGGGIVEPEGIHQGGGAVGIVGRAQTGAHERPGGGESGEVGFLGQVTDCGARLKKTNSCI